MLAEGTRVFRDYPGGATDYGTVTRRRDVLTHARQEYGVTGTVTVLIDRPGEVWMTHTFPDDESLLEVWTPLPSGDTAVEEGL